MIDGIMCCMRGSVENQSTVVMVNPESMVPSDHPIRVIKKIVDEAPSVPVPDGAIAPSGLF